MLFWPFFWFQDISTKPSHEQIKNALDRVASGETSATATADDEGLQTEPLEAEVQADAPDDEHKSHEASRSSTDSSSSSSSESKHKHK